MGQRVEGQYVGLLSCEDKVLVEFEGGGRNRALVLQLPPFDASHLDVLLGLWGIRGKTDQKTNGSFCFILTVSFRTSASSTAICSCFCISSPNASEGFAGS